MPQMGESVTEGTILEWHVAEGQAVAEGDTVVEVSTDKIDAEVPAPASGVVTRILAQPDDTVEVGQVLAQIDPNGDPSGNGASAAAEPEDAAPLAEPSPDPAAPGGEAEETGPSADPAAPGGEAEEAGGTFVVSMPEMGESVTEGTILEWHVAEGQAVAEGDTVVEVSTDKIDAEVPAPANGTITKLLAAVDDTVQVGQALAEMAWAGPHRVRRRAAPASGETAAPEAGAATGRPTDGASASPVARRVAAAKGVDLGSLSGSGAGGKIVKADVLAAADGKGAASPAAREPRQSRFADPRRCWPRR